MAMVLPQRLIQCDFYVPEMVPEKPRRVVGTCRHAYVQTITNSTPADRACPIEQ